MWHSDNFLALPAEVIAFAWSAPMRELAARLGISDVGLKKLLRSQGIPTPPQGHWNRIHAGREVVDPPQPPARGPGECGRIRLDLRFKGHIPEADEMPEEGPFASSRVPEDLKELRQMELAAIGKAPAPKDLSKPTAGLNRILKAETARREKAAASRWSWDEPHFDTALAKRQMRILNGLFRALERRGCACEAVEDNYDLRARCFIGDQTCELHFEVIGKHSIEIRGGYHRPARDLAATTPIRLMLNRSLRGSVTNAWSDTPDLPLEKQLATIAADVIVAGEASFRQGLIEAREHREEIRRWEEERRQQKLRERELKRTVDLKKSAELLRQAEDMRALINKVERAMAADSARSISAEQIARWKRWALSQANELDPVLSGQVLEHLHVPELDDPEQDQSDV